MTDLLTPPPHPRRPCRFSEREIIMSTGIKRPFVMMNEIAKKMADSLAPCCKRIMVAGSIRREKAEIGDIEIVAIADGDKLTERLNSALEAGKIRHVESGPKKTKRWGEKMKSFLFDATDGQPVQVDVFICQPETWGYTLLVRTGSGDFSNRMVTPINKRTHEGLPGLMPVQYKCIESRVCTLDGKPLDTPEESDIFYLYGLETVEPKLRTDDCKPKVRTPTGRPLKPGYRRIPGDTPDVYWDVRMWQEGEMEMPPMELLRKLRSERSTQG